ncbi:MAG TPA: asparagine synthase (glutamine-hydrolyzing) [Verrucomicrobiae bacterium]|nr:asparagine synthase (glutamine-hydrolyzing) [Verrucomicrobiae bacterium]
MCGVCGYVSLSGPFSDAAASQRVHAMIEALAHRGPDESGISSVNPAVLGATRLAIRGLESGKQPIVDKDSGVMVVCNGEIDNHQELRQWLVSRQRRIELATDVAVIPGLYLELGETFVERLVGAFAVALWDSRQQRLLLARDRAGERPLFFTVQDGLVRFATEIAALASDKTLTLRPDCDALQSYLQYGCFVAPATPFHQIQKVAPAEIVSIEPGRILRRRYWNWNIAKTPKQKPSLEEFDDVFREAVRRQTDVDVPYGAFLSGGVDSSLVAAVARSVRPDFRFATYTLRFSEESYDEGVFAEQVAQTLGLQSTTVWVRPESFSSGIAELVELVGEPLADPAWIPTALLARRAAQDVKVALVGEGGDELFGGYPTYIGALAAQYYARLPRPLRATIKAGVEAWPVSDKKVTTSYVLKRFVQGAAMDGVARHLLWTSNLSPALLERLGLPRRAEPRRQLDVEPILDVVQQHDLETTLAEGLLTKADRASMRSALELRTPFLDKAVMEYAATLPAEERVRRLTTKVFLKRYALRYLPPGIVHRRKRGLSVPLASWLRGPLADWAESRLRSNQLASVGISSPACLELLKEHRQRRADHARALWTLIVLSEWLTWASKQATDGQAESSA